MKSDQTRPLTGQDRITDRTTECRRRSFLLEPSLFLLHPSPMDVASEEFWKSRDLPQRLGPMTVKELRQGLRRGSFVYPFLAIHLLAIIAMAAEFQMTDEVEGTTDYIGSLNLLLFLPGVDVSSGPFWAVVGAICLVLMPLGGLALMGQELEDGNHELLLMTPLSRWKVVRGKFLALWGLCLMTFVSLLPYMIVRYLIGGIDPVRNIFMAVTVVVFSAMMTAGGIGASSFTGIVARIATLILFTGSMLLSLLFVGWGSAWRSEEAGFHPAGVIYHLNAFSAAFCYIILGLALARSRIRLVVHHYEVKPSWMIIGLLLFTPFVAGMAALFTVGFAGGVGLIGMGLVAWFADTSPKAPKWVQAPAPNVPPLPPTAAALPVEGEAGLPVDPPQVDEGLSKLEEAKEPSESEEP